MAVARLARAIKGAGLCDSVVLGYDTLNEPSMGFIGVEDVRCIAKEQELRKGLTPSPLQAMLLGMGNRVERVEEWDMTAIGPQKLADRILDPKGVKVSFSYTDICTRLDVDSYTDIYIQHQKP